MWENVSLEVTEGIALLKVNRPQVLNALNTKTLEELGEAVQAIKNDSSIDVVIVTGAGEKAFVAGADIAEMRDKTANEGLTFSSLGQKVFTELANLPQPVIAAVNGFALGGGCELAMACDIRVAGDNAKFGQPEVGLGITPGFAGTQRLARLVGPGKAKELIFTGDVIKAEEALRIGLVEQVVPKEEVMNKAMELARKIQKRGKIAVKQAKLCINRGLDSSFQTGEAFEAQAFAVCFASEDQKEAMSAFLEKREANWKNK